MQLIDRYADLEGVRLHYVEAQGESADGPLVVLLHGFPEFWYSWRHQIPALSASGFRVVAPDLRGYNLSDKPRAVSAYRGHLLARDVAQLIEHCGASSAAVVGHDWGGGVAWLAASRYPQHVERLVILNAPHPVRFGRALGTWQQLRKSWYMLFFQVPWLPELVFGARSYLVVRRTFRADAVRCGAFSDEDLERYVAALAQRGALSCAMNYYRAALRYRSEFHEQLRPIEQPVMVIWGELDRYLGRELAQPDLAWVPHAHVERISNAGHWVQIDCPEHVNRLLIDFLTAALHHTVPQASAVSGGE